MGAIRSKEALGSKKNRKESLVRHQNGRRTKNQKLTKKIFDYVDIHGLIRCLYVSRTWRQLAEEELVNRLSETDGYGRTPITLACIYGYTYVLKIILNCSQSLDLNIKTLSPSYNMQTPFMFACENGHEDVVKLLLDYSGSQEIDFNIQCSSKRTAFMLACKRGQLKVVRLLLDRSASKSIDLKKRDMHGLTALMIACEYGQNEVFRNILNDFENDAFDSDIQDENGLTTFVLACKIGQTEMVQAMLDHPNSVKLNNKDPVGTTQFLNGFLQASRFSQVDVVNLLFRHRTNMEPIREPREAETYDELLEDLGFIVESDEADNDEESDDIDNDNDVDRQ